MLIPNIDVNMRAQQVPNYPNSKYYKNQPILHMIVLQNDYEMLKIFLHVPDSLAERGVSRSFDFQAKDNFDRNACDLALELGY